MKEAGKPVDLRPAGKMPSVPDILRATRMVYDRELDLDRKNRASMPTQREIEAEKLHIYEELRRDDGLDNRLAVGFAVTEFEMFRDQAKTDRERRSLLLEELRKHVSRGETALIEWAADEAIEREGWSIEKDSHPYKRLCQHLLLAQIDALGRMQERDEGQFDDTPHDQELAAVPKAGALPPEEVNTTALTETVGTLAAEYLETRTDVTPEWDKSLRAGMRLFLDYVGADTPPSSIDKRTIRAWVTELRKYPSRGSMRRDNKGATFKEIVARNETEGRPVLAPRTVNKLLSAISGFMDWLVKNDVIEANPTDAQRLPEKKHRVRRETFSADQLQTLFTSPLFTGCRSGVRRPDLAQPGSVRVRDHRYWVPLLGVWTGARAGELLALRTRDVQEIDGIWCFRIKGTKTAAAVRDVPVHPELRRLGFLDFLQTMKDAGHDRLFPGVVPDSLDRISSEFSKAFSDYIKRIGLKRDNRTVFHSLRHTFVDELRRRGYADSVIAVFVGHSGGTITSEYGKLPQFGPKQRLQIISKVKHDGLTLKHLYPR